MLPHGAFDRTGRGVRHARDALALSAFIVTGVIIVALDHKQCMSDALLDFSVAIGGGLALTD